MGTPSKVPLLMAVLLLTLHSRLTTATWCVARSDASREALQTALDYACSAGADCAPLQPSGLCFLPNTIQAHASYAFNSYYMRRFMAPGSCDFSGTATFAKTDPSYGSCVYPPSPRLVGCYPFYVCFQKKRKKHASHLCLRLFKS
ncbi:putative carbohydrate-binding X8 domain-containing protein, plant [Helianthus annuus]|nr:putative X8 domain-containing protein [Helianthus annuus]KAJ0727354.1 putative carbohydrate-binding X8 domain-containing protein, plant [Helianthus annuus]KAJ0730151.1 putative carbohydrate-binding X8 domain-containing protein, plant [Helianthus annuus]